MHAISSAKTAAVVVEARQTIACGDGSYGVSGPIQKYAPCAMIFQCSACAQKPGLGPKMIHEEGNYNFGFCWGICNNRGIVVCIGHGRRIEIAYQYHCTCSTGNYIQKGGFLPDDPSDPTPPPSNLDDLVVAVSDLKVEIKQYMKDMKAKVEGHLRDKVEYLDSPLDEDALKVSAKAYRKATRIPEPIRREVRVPA